MSVQTPRKDIGPFVCTQCRKLVRWERKDGVLVLVNDASGTPHVCQAGR